MLIEDNVPNERLRRARHLKGWTQSKLAEMLGTDFETVSRWERGITMPSAYFRERLSSVLEKSLEELGLIADRDEQLAPSTSPCVFLASAYADAEREFVTDLRAHLQARGITVLSSRTLRRQGAQNQRQALQEAIRTAKTVLLIASPEARSSRLVQKALQIAGIYKCQICAVWIDGEWWSACVPPDYGQLFATIDARKNNAHPVFDEIIAKLEEARLVSNEPAVSIATTNESAEPPFEPRNPYKGLKAFHSEDRDDFFGRDALVNELADALHAFLIEDEKHTRHARFLAVVGPSGSGKSSVVMAGLLPRLQAGELPGSQHWVYLDPIIPGAHPIESLAFTFAQRLPDRSLKTIREDLDDDSTYGVHLLAHSLRKRAETHVVLFIDQFEEVFTQTISEEERQQFLDLLVTAVSWTQGPTLLILTLRADFYDRPMHYPDLFHLIEARHSFMLPLALKELREVIEKPADLPDVQLTFEGDLVSDLLFGVQEQAGALPLLQFTLDQLFHRRSGHQLTLKAFEEIGGVKGAVAKHAETTYTGLPSEEHRKLARVLFLRLIEPGATAQETTRRRIIRSELLLSNPKDTAILEEVTRTFTVARLLTTNLVAGVATVEVSHEAVIREWTRLADWIDEAREDIHRQQSISEAATEWAKNGKPRDRLYRGTQLKDAQAWTNRNTPSENEATFLRASAGHRTRSRVGVITSCILVALLLLLVGFQNREVFFPPDPTLVTNLADNGSGSLRQAVIKAKPGSTITFDTHLKGVINLVSNIAIDRDLSIRGPGTGNLSIAGSGGFNVLLVEPGASVTISGLAFRGTNQLQKSSGIIINEGTLTLTSITVSGNSTYNSGSITNSGTLTLNNSTVSGNKSTSSNNISAASGIDNVGTLTLNNSTISDNTTNSGGGGISNGGVLTINSSTISHNTSTNSEGGGILNNNSLTIRNSSIIGNTAFAGAGISNSNGSLTLSNSTISGNSAFNLGYGGGILNVNGSTLTLTNSTFSGNSAGYGGGVDNGYIFGPDNTYNRGGPLTLTNSTISDNTAIDGGGILANTGSQTNITFSTIYGNTATGEGGGIANKTYDSRKPGQVELRNTLVAENRALLTGPDIAGMVVSDGYNLIQNSSGTTFIPNQQHLTDVHVHADEDIGISSLLSGNQVQILALLPGSPAIDRIPLDACDINGIFTDQLGVIRPDGNEEVCDIGAYESSP
jgi:transcriptional regulator with XRE-family HTH domain